MPFKQIVHVIDINTGKIVFGMTLGNNELTKTGEKLKCGEIWEPTVKEFVVELLEYQNQMTEKVMDIYKGDPNDWRKVFLNDDPNYELGKLIGGKNWLLTQWSTYLIMTLKPYIKEVTSDNWCGEYSWIDNHKVVVTTKEIFRKNTTNK